MLTKTYKENLGLSWNPLTVFVAAYIIEELLLDGTLNLEPFCIFFI